MEDCAYIISFEQDQNQMSKFTNKGMECMFLPVSANIAQEINQDHLALTSPFYLNRSTDQELYLMMTSRFIVLCQKQALDYNYLYYTTLDFELKFEVLTDLPSGPYKEANSIASIPTGFRLVRKNTEIVDLHIISSNVIGVWVEYLGKKLNQIGFHRMFKPLRKLGKGGFATVYEVQRLTDGRLFAVKAFSKQNTLNSKNPSHKQNLLNEIYFMRTINSDHLIKLEGVFESENSLYVVLQLLANGHLHDKINKRQGKYQLSEVRVIVKALAKGLKELHEKNIMHRDLKPQNIMMRNDYDPVIADFGLAADFTWDDYLFYRCGTPGYVAPEVTTLEKGQKISPVCDIFSLGVILHILLMGKPLFAGRKFEQVYDNNKKLRFNLKSSEYDGLDPEARDLMERMLKINPKERLSADEVLNHSFLDSDTMVQEKEEVMTPYLSPRRVMKA